MLELFVPLPWRDKEFIDDYDHGRQLQSAVSFDNLGEVFNPTEAGSSDQDDGINPSPSSSILMGYWNTEKVLATQTNMAFFRPYNRQKVSNYILNKTVTLGAHGLPHVIQYSTQFTLPEESAFGHGIFEVVTGYMPTEFSEFWTYDIKK